MDKLQNSLQGVKSRIAEAAHQAGRDPRDILLVAVSKTFPAAAIAQVYAAGQRDFGENYVQEAFDKIAALSQLAIVWHFIGPIQSNKTRPIAEHFHWVHSVDRLKIAERLSAQRPAVSGALNVCLQVNVSGEASKSGCAPQEVVALAHAVARLPRLTLRGLMAVPEPTDDVHLQRTRFEMLAALQRQLQGSGLALDTLSMGMSGDLEQAVAAGATIVRVGTAIFGSRPGPAG